MGSPRQRHRTYYHDDPRVNNATNAYHDERDIRRSTREYYYDDSNISRQDINRRNEEPQRDREVSLVHRSSSYDRERYSTPTLQSSIYEQETYRSMPNQYPVYDQQRYRLPPLRSPMYNQEVYRYPAQLNPVYDHERNRFPTHETLIYGQDRYRSSTYQSPTYNREENRSIIHQSPTYIREDYRSRTRRSPNHDRARERSPVRQSHTSFRERHEFSGHRSYSQERGREPSPTRRSPTYDRHREITPDRRDYSRDRGRETSSPRRSLIYDRYSNRSPDRRRYSEDRERENPPTRRSPKQDRYRDKIPDYRRYSKDREREKSPTRRSLVYDQDIHRTGDIAEPPQQRRNSAKSKKRPYRSRGRQTKLPTAENSILSPGQVKPFADTKEEENATSMKLTYAEKLGLGYPFTKERQQIQPELDNHHTLESTTFTTDAESHAKNIPSEIMGDGIKNHVQTNQPLSELEEPQPAVSPGTGDQEFDKKSTRLPPPDLTTTKLVDMPQFCGIVQPLDMSSADTGSDNGNDVSNISRPATPDESMGILTDEIDYLIENRQILGQLEQEPCSKFTEDIKSNTDLLKDIQEIRAKHKSIDTQTMESTGDNSELITNDTGTLRPKQAQEAQTEAMDIELNESIDDNSSAMHMNTTADMPDIENAEPEQQRIISNKCILM